MKWSAIFGVAMWLSSGAALAERPAPPPFPPSGYDSHSFRELGADDGIRLTEDRREESVRYALRGDQVATAARLHLVVANSSGFPEETRLQILLDGDPLGMVDIGSKAHEATAVDLPINPVLLDASSRFDFKLLGAAAASCRVAENPPAVSIAAVSALDIVAKDLPLANNLAILPLPFFDFRDPRRIVTNFVFYHAPSDKALEAAGIVASWFGSLAGQRGVELPARFGGILAGNAIVFLSGDDEIPGLTLPQAVAPTLAMVDNPIDPSAKLLLVLGHDDEDLKVAALGLTLGTASLPAAPVAAVPPQPAAARRPYDAPGWLADNRPVKFSEFASAGSLRVTGFQPKEIILDFKAAPDHFNGAGAEIPMKIRFNVAPESAVDLGASRLDVFLNQSRLRSLPLGEGVAYSAPNRPIHEQTIDIPASLLSGHNRLTLAFDLVPGRQCDGAAAAALTSDIDPDSTIDLSGSPHYAPMPNLSLFASAGFPFTRYADLAETGVVLPNPGTPNDVEAFLETLALFGDATNYPALGTRVVRPAHVDALAARDMLIIGSFSSQRLLAKWLPAAGLSDQGGVLRPSKITLWTRIATLLDWRNRNRIPPNENWGASPDNLEGALIGFASPFDVRRSVVAITGTYPAQLIEVTRLLQSRERLDQIRDGVMLVRGRDVESHQVATPPHDVGAISHWDWMRWKLSDRPFLMAILVFAACASLAASSYVVLGVKARRRLQGAAR
jgi:cellulose synthase operon protein B